MQAIQENPGPEKTNSFERFMPYGIYLLVLMLAVLFFSFSGGIFPARPAAPERTSISQSTLEEKYGLRVNLIALTAAGGMLDLRLKISDADKAKLLLQDKKNFPVLLVGNGSKTLKVSEEISAQAIKFENNGDVFLLFPNTQNTVKRDDAVVILFGDLALEPIAAR